jgi:hypothetical protein
MFKNRLCTFIKLHYNAIAHGKRDDNIFYGGLLLWPLKHLLNLFASQVANLHGH